MELCC